MDLQSMDPVTLAVLKGRLEKIACESVPDFLLQMAQAGGLIANLKQRMVQGSEKTDG